MRVLDYLEKGGIIFRTTVKGEGEKNGVKEVENHYLLSKRRMRLTVGKEGRDLGWGGEGEAMY